MQMEIREDCTLVGLFCGVLGSLIGVTLEPKKRSFNMNVSDRLTTTSGVSYSVSMLRFV